MKFNLGAVIVETGNRVYVKSLEAVTFLKDLWLKTVNSFEEPNFRNNKELN